MPGYGITLQNGFEDVFTSTAMAALEWGAMAYARGLINNQQVSHILGNDERINSAVCSCARRRCRGVRATPRTGAKKMMVALVAKPTHHSCLAGS